MQEPQEIGNKFELLLSTLPNFVGKVDWGSKRTKARLAVIFGLVLGFSRMELASVITKFGYKPRSVNRILSALTRDLDLKDTTLRRRGKWGRPGTAPGPGRPPKTLGLPLAKPVAKDVEIACKETLIRNPQVFLRSTEMQRLFLGLLTRTESRKALIEVLRELGVRPFDTQQPISGDSPHLLAGAMLTLLEVADQGNLGRELMVGLELNRMAGLTALLDAESSGS